MRITIENYRGFDIEFDTDQEKFICVVADESSKDSKSFSAVKKFIDDYKKDNQEFTPFWVEPKPTSYQKDKLMVIGLRKDDMFVAKKENGERVQISTYEESSYMLVKKENSESLDLLSKLEGQFQLQRDQYEKSKKEIISNIDIKTLKDWRASNNP